jgi:hypothetical protein
MNRRAGKEKLRPDQKLEHLDRHHHRESNPT